MRNPVGDDLTVPIFGLEVVEADADPCTVELVEVAVTLLFCDVVASLYVAVWVVLKLEDVVVAAVMTERSSALYILFSCASSIVTLQGLGDGATDVVTGQILYPLTTE